MTNKLEKPSVAELIDADNGLRSKRKLLTITSLILLLLSFSDAKIIEANTFLIKLSFENQSGISVLLVIAILFLLIRYYNYAYKYHQMIYSIWTQKMLNHHFFFCSNPVDDFEYYGLIAASQPKNFNLESITQEGGTFSFEYRCDYIFIRKIIYNWHDQYLDHDFAVKIGFKNYFKVVKLEAYFQLQSFFIDRERLDIYTPYILGISAILSYFYNDTVQQILQIIIG